ncbi:MAG: hypothetical protein ACI4WT_10070 [Oligosphaeraceae bacterium]
MSMSGVTELGTILNLEFATHQEGELRMKEKGESGTLKNVLLTGLDTNGITLKGDQAKIKIFKRGYAGSCCDYIILTTSHGQNVVVFVELKSTIPESDHLASHPTIQPNGKYEHYVEQLSGGDCLFSYLDKVLESFLGCTALQHYRRQHVVLYENVHSPRTALSLPIMPTMAITRIPASNPAIAAKLLHVHNDSSIPVECLLA